MASISNHTESDSSEESVSNHVDLFNMTDSSNALDEPSATTPTLEATTQALTTRELLESILSQVPCDTLVNVRRVSKAWNVVISEIGYHVEPYGPTEIHEHENPTPHYPTPHYPTPQCPIPQCPTPHYSASMSFKFHPAFRHAARRAFYTSKKPLAKFVLHMLKLRDPKEVMRQKLHDDQFITNPPITKINTCLMFKGSSVTRLTPLRVPSGIRFRHLLELCDQYSTRTGARSGYDELNGLYACFMVCNDCEDHVRSPDHFSTGVDEDLQPDELTKLRPELVKSAQQFGTLKEKYMHYQSQQEELYGCEKRFAFQQQEAWTLERAIVDMTGTHSTCSIDKDIWMVGRGTLLMRKPEYVAGENDTQQRIKMPMDGDVEPQGTSADMVIATRP
jgi:hypothetical protein